MANEKKPLPPPHGRGGANTRDRILFAKHLAIMTEAGLPLTEALAVINEHTKSRKFRVVLAGATHDVENGQFLSVALAKFPHAFDEFATSLIRVGEESGRLPENLKYLSEQLEHAEELRRKIVGALIYPAVLLAGTLGVVAFLSFVTLPQLLPVFTGLRIKLPLITRILIAASSWFTHNILWVLLGVVLAIIIMHFLFRYPRVRYAWHVVLLRIPVLGELLQNAQLTSFSRILGTLLTAGVDVVRSLDIAGRSMTNLVYRRQLQEIAKNMRGQGESIADYLKRHERLFPSVVQRMIQVGEKTGKLDETLFYVGEFYSKEIDNSVRTLTTLLEPIILLVMGVVVGFVALSIITPIYELTRGLTR